MSKILRGLAAGMILMITVMAGSSLFIVPVKAESEGFNEICNDSQISNELKKSAGCFEKRKIPEVGVKIMNFFIGLIALSGVLAVIFAGQRMVTGAEDTGKVKQARVMIAYGVAGIVVAMIAFTVVNFILQGLTK